MSLTESITSSHRKQTINTVGSNKLLAILFLFNSTERTVGVHCTGNYKNYNVFMHMLKQQLL